MIIINLGYDKYKNIYSMLKINENSILKMYNFLRLYN